MTINRGKYLKRKKRATKSKRITNQELVVASDKLARPKEYANILGVVTFAKSAVYCITRIRQSGNQTAVSTIGTGFLCSPNKLMTCQHVINNEENKHAMSKHQDGDTYYLLSIDEDEHRHWHTLTATLDRNLHIYPDIDMALFTLNDDFYYSTKKVLQNKNKYIPLAVDGIPLCSEVAVIGYPIEQNKGGVYINASTKEIETENIMMRTDMGVVNTRYEDKDDSVHKYEFTMAFNPGNSGGPIVDSLGRVVAIVHGYKAFPIKVIEEKYTTNVPGKAVKNKTQLATLRATYSIGFSSTNAADIIKEHSLDSA